MPKAEFYIRIDTYQQNSPDTFFGPYPNTEAAEAALKDSGVARDDKGQGPSDIKNQTRCWGILKTTWARKCGMSWRNTIPAQDTVPGNSYELRGITDLYLSGI